MILENSSNKLNWIKEICFSRVEWAHCVPSWLLGGKTSTTTATLTVDETVPNGAWSSRTVRPFTCYISAILFTNIQQHLKPLLHRWHKLTWQLMWYWMFTKFPQRNSLQIQVYNCFCLFGFFFKWKVVKGKVHWFTRQPAETAGSDCTRPKKSPVHNLP